MVITELKPIQNIIDSLKKHRNIFILGCGECATACKTGGEPEVLKMRDLLISAGKNVTGYSIPSAPCIALKLRSELRKDGGPLERTDAVLVLACGLGVQSFKENDKLGLPVFPGCDTVFGAVMDSRGNFYEKCSMCGECVLDLTAGVCPVTLCPKGLLNGPCGGMNKGKCELDSERDCAWVLIYKELEDEKRGGVFKEIRPPKDYRKFGRPRKLILNKKNK